MPALMSTAGNRVTAPNNGAVISHPSEVNSRSYYATSTEHLLAEMDLIYLLVQLQVRSAQRVAPINDVQGLVITEEEVEGILARPAGTLSFSAHGPAEGSNVLLKMREQVGQRKAESLRRGVEL